MSKVPTYMFQNILLILLSAPPFAAFIMGVMVFTSSKLPSYWMMPVTIAFAIAFIVAGVVLSLNCARKIKQLAMSGQGEEGLKIAKRVNKYFLGVLVLTWIFGFLSAVYVPSYAAYRSRGYDASSRYDLKNFYIAANKYFQNNPEGTIDIESAKQYGFKPTSDVKLDVHGGKQVNFKVTAVHPSGTEAYTIDNRGEISAIKKVSRIP